MTAAYDPHADWAREDRLALVPVAPQCFAHLSRVELLDRINCLLMFDRDGSGADEAMGLLKWNQTVTAEELNARLADRFRPVYRPVR